MPFHFTCPYCFKKTLVDESFSGQEGPCSRCGKTVKVPEPPAQAPAGLHPADAQPIPKTRKKNTFWPTLLYRSACVLLLLLIVGIFGRYAVSPIFSDLKARRDQTACRNNLNLIAKALNSYAAEYGTYPPPYTIDDNGKPMHSWRVLILPQLGEQSLYDDYKMDEPWDSADNSSLFQRCPRVYISPAADDWSQSTYTSYMLITGPGTIFPPQGPLAPEDISDDPQQTLLVVEVYNNGSDWTKPEDIDRSKMNSTIGKKPIGVINTAPTAIGGNHIGGATGVFADETSAWIPEDLSPGVLDALLTPNGSEPVDATELNSQ